MLAKEHREQDILGVQNSSQRHGECSQRSCIPTLCRVIITHGESLGGLLSVEELVYIVLENLRVFLKQSAFLYRGTICIPFYV